MGKRIKVRVNQDIILDDSSITTIDAKISARIRTSPKNKHNQIKKKMNFGYNYNQQHNILLSCVWILVLFPFTIHYIHSEFKPQRGISY